VTFGKEKPLLPKLKTVGGNKVNVGKQSTRLEKYIKDSKKGK
jgi:hypothetical protein